MVTTIDADGVVHQSAPLTGRPPGQALAVGSDGTVYVTTSVNDGAQGQTHVAVVGSDGSLRVSDPLAGFASGGVAFDGTGTAYQSTDQGTSVLDPSDWTPVTLTV